MGYSLLYTCKAPSKPKAPRMKANRKVMTLNRMAEGGYLCIGGDYQKRYGSFEEGYNFFVKRGFKRMGKKEEALWKEWITKERLEAGPKDVVPIMVLERIRWFW